MMTEKVTIQQPVSYNDDREGYHPTTSKLQWWQKVTIQQPVSYNDDRRLPSNNQ